DRFVTFAAAVLDPADHSVTLLSAGHPSPLLYHGTNGDIEEVVPRKMAGVPLGMLPAQEYTSCRVLLQPGDCVVLFSDGVTDAYSVRNVAFHLKGIYAALEHGGPYSPQAAGDRIVKAVRAHAAGRSPHDDITLVCFGRTT